MKFCVMLPFWMIVDWISPSLPNSSSSRLKQMKVL